MAILDNSEVVIAFFALVVSCVSIFLTLISLKVQRQHNLKSIRPIGRLTAGDYEDDIYISIVNEGIGPLIIKELKVKSDRISAFSLIDIVPDHINSVVIWTDFAANFVGRAIMSGDRLYLLRKTFDDTDKLKEENEKTREILRKFFQHLTLELTYVDIYNAQYKVERKFDWFGRHFEPKVPHKQARKSAQTI